MPTAYANYRDYLLKVSPDVIYEFERSMYVVEDGDSGSSKETRWNELEKSLGLLWDECVQVAINEHFPNMADDRPGWDDARIEVDMATRFVSGIAGLPFIKWVQSIDLSKTVAKFHLPTDGYYITFNYTETLERVYDIAGERILHLHGKRGDSRYPLQFGSPKNDPNVVLSDIEKRWREDDFYTAVIEPCIRIAEDRCRSASKNLTKNYYRLAAFIDTMPRGSCASVRVMGHSFDGVDYPYYCDVLAPRFIDAEWQFFTRGGSKEKIEENEEKVLRFCAGLGIRDYKIRFYDSFL